MQTAVANRNCLNLYINSNTVKSFKNTYKSAVVMVNYYRCFLINGRATTIISSEFCNCFLNYFK